MVLESQGDYQLAMGDNLFHCFQRLAVRGDCVSSVRQDVSRDTGGGDGGLTTAAERQHLKELNVKIVNCAAVTISFAEASAYFAKAEFDRLWKSDATAG